MDQTRWQTIETLFTELLPMSAAERDAWLAQNHADDERLQQEVRRLLAAEQRADAFMVRMETSANRLVWEPFNDGDEIQHYRIEHEIGSGGMGTVYKAIDLRLDRPVALKFLHVHRAQNSQDKERFKREARAASRLTHDNIATIYEIGETDAGMLYIAMAYCEGRGLDELLEESGVTPLDAIRIVRQLAAALSEAHHSGILHRDLKPANLIIDNKGHARLVDFGIAKILGDDVTATAAGFGTAAYMAPEQFGREPVDTRTDLWSAGCILYEMLTGRRPFLGESPAEIMYSVLNHHFPLVRSLRPELPAGIDNIIGRCLTRNVDERFNSAQELGDALRRLQESLEALDLPPPSRRLDTGTVERKYVTALYYRLVSSRNGKHKKSNAELPDLASRICHQYGGFVLHAAGDAGAILLGYPIAEEQAGEKAVRCGLELLAKARELGIDIAVGAHTGFLLSETGRPADREQLSAEHPVRSAARLCELASAGDMLINDRLERHVANRFRVMQHGKAFKVSQAEPTAGSHAASARLTPLCGRIHERGILLDAWERVQDDEGQIISISGEPGIGKSRMVHELKQTVATQTDASVIECLCAPYQRNTALYPVVAWLEQQLGLPKLNSAEEKQARVNHFGRERGLDNGQLGLLHLLLKTGPATPGMGGETIRQETLLLLEKILLYNSGPLLVIFEDLHWADPTTIDLLNVCIERGTTPQVLLLCTYRPNFQPRWHGRAHIANLSLNRLNKRDTLQMAKSLLASHDAAEELMTGVAARTDGVPLFIEELTQSILERLPDDRQHHTDSIIPFTLQESLQARIDALGAAKNLAQLSAVIGRDFSDALLRVFARPMDHQEFDKQLASLVRSQLVNTVGGDQHMHYRFKHALIRDAAYQSLTVENRRQLHLNFATMLQTDFPQLANEQPEVIAQHLTEAGENIPAAQFWLRAGQIALQQFAIIETRSHCEQGLEQLANLAPGPETLPLELQLQVTLGPALMALKGYSDVEVDKAYTRARDICRMLGDPPSVFPVIYGLWTVHCVRAQHLQAAELAEQLMTMADAAQDASMQAAAYLATAITHAYRGNFLAAREHIAQGLSLYHFDMAQDHIIYYGQDSGASYYAFQTVNEWILGNTEASDRIAIQAVEHGKRSEHPQSMAFGLTFAGGQALYRGQLDLARDRLTTAITLCKKHSVHIFLMLATVLNEIRLVFINDPHGSIENIRQAIENFTAAGAGLYVSSWRVFLAQFLIEAGDITQAKNEINHARAIIEANDERWCAAEVERVDGEIALIEGDTERARKQFEAALAIAEQQQAVAWRELALVSLAKLQNN